MIIIIITIIAIIAITDNNDNKFDDNNNNNNNNNSNNVSCYCHYPCRFKRATSSHPEFQAVSKAMPSEALASLCASKLPEARSPVGRWGWRRRPSHHLLTRPAIKGHHQFPATKNRDIGVGWWGVSLNFPKKALTGSFKWGLKAWILKVFIFILEKRKIIGSNIIVPQKLKMVHPKIGGLWNGRCFFLEASCLGSMWNLECIQWSYIFLLAGSDLQLLLVPQPNSHGAGGISKDLVRIESDLELPGAFCYCTLLASHLAKRMPPRKYPCNISFDGTRLSSL